MYIQINSSKSKRSNRPVLSATGGKYKVIYNTADDYGWYGAQMPLSFAVTANNDIDAVYNAWEKLYGDLDESDKETVDDYINQFHNGEDLDVEFSADTNTIMFVVKGSRVVFSAFGNSNPNEIMQDSWDEWLEVHEDPEDEDQEEIYNDMISKYPNGWTIQNFNVTRSNY